jgi:hypothetical protein
MIRLLVLVLCALVVLPAAATQFASATKPAPLVKNGIWYDYNIQKE